jgi:hypothetical protein
MPQGCNTVVSMLKDEVFQTEQPRSKVTSCGSAGLVEGSDRHLHSCTRASGITQKNTVTHVQCDDKTVFNALE